MDITKDLWIGSTVDVRTGEEAKKALLETSDHKYWSDDTGITKVDKERWERAQKYEHDCWMRHATTASSDRHDEHLNKFNNYTDLPAELGKTVEIGCGPFTQLSMIIKCRKIPAGIVLCDPLASSYLEHPNCTYKDGYLDSIKISKIASIPGEEFTDTDFDTAICVNVLEHVRDACLVLDNLYNCLKVGGLIVFSDRAWDGLDTSKVYDAGHPIRLKRKVLDAFRDRFRVIYQNGDYFIGIKQ